MIMLCCAGHLLPSGDDDGGGADSIMATLEQCRAQNRQLISEMRKLMCLMDGPFISLIVTECSYNYYASFILVFREFYCS